MPTFMLVAPGGWMQRPAWMPEVTMEAQRAKILAHGCAAALLSCLPMTGRADSVTVASETFNTLGTAADATLPASWRIDATASLSAETARRPVAWADATNATTQAFTGTMMGTSAGGLYNFGSNAADRAAGWLATGSGCRNGNLYWRYQHAGPDAIGHFTLAYAGRKFRHGTNEAGFSLRLFFSTNDATWTEVPVACLSWEGGSAPADELVTTKAVTHVLVNQPLAAGGTIFFAWNYCVSSGTSTTYAQGLGIDDVVITAHPPLENPPAIHVSTNSLAGFSTLVGTASDAQAFTLSGSNLTEAVTLTTPDNFELSWDGVHYAASLTNLHAGAIAPCSVRVRLAAAPAPASVAGLLTIAGGGLLAPVEITLAGDILRDRSHLVFREDFETGSKTSYAAGEVDATEGRWLFDNALIGTSADDQRNDGAAARLRSSGGELTMLFDKTNGVGEVSLFHGLYGSDSGVGVNWTLAVSRDAGATWNAFVSDAQTTAAAWRETVFGNVNVAGDVRLKLTVSGGSDAKRINVDDLAMSDYVAPALVATPASLDPFAARLHTPSTPQAVTVSGVNLSHLVVVTAPAGYAVSLQEASGYDTTATLAPTNGRVEPTPVQVRLQGAAEGSCTGCVTVASAGAASVPVAVTGTVLANLPPVITGLPDATNTVANHPLRLDLRAADPDGTVVQLAASSATLPEAAACLEVESVSGGLAGHWRWTPVQEGAHVVTFTATDNEGGVAAHAVTLAVAPEWRVPVRPGQTIREAFDAMPDGLSANATLPVGWKGGLSATPSAAGSFADAATATSLRGGNNLSASATAGLYNFGAGDPATAADRAIGFLCKGEAIKSGSLMVRLVNVSRDIIPAFSLAFDAEKYRMGTNPEGFAIELHTSPDGVQWMPAGEPFLIFFPSDDVTAGYEAAPGASARCAGTLGPLRLPPGASLYLAWHYRVAAGTATTYAQAIGLDNIEITPHGPPQTILILR